MARVYLAGEGRGELVGNDNRLLPRRDLLRMAGAGAAGSALAAVAGCRGFNTGGGSEGLTVTWWGEGDRSRRTVEVAKLFQSQHDGVQIKGQFSSYDGYYDKLATRVAGGNPPDIFQLHISTMTDYAKRGAIRGLDDLWDGPLGLGDLPEHIRAACTLDGKLYFVPLGLATQPALIYNKTLLGELGVDEPAADWTMDDFRRFTRDVTRAGGGDVYGTANMGDSDTAISAHLRSQGKSLFNEGGKLAISKNDLTSWLTMWQQMRQDGECVPMEVTAARTGFQNDPMVKRKTPLTATASSKGLEGLANLMDDELGLAAFPKQSADSPQGTMFGPVEWWAFRSDLGDDRAKTAASFCRFLLTDPKALSIMKLTHGVPLFPDLREKRAAQASGVNAIIFDNARAIAEQNPEPLSIYPAGAQELLETQLEEINQKIGFGKMSPEAGADAFFSSADEILG